MVKVIMLIFMVLVSLSGFARLDTIPEKTSIMTPSSSLITAGIVTAGSYTILHQLWYKDYDRQSFHFFNDLNEWNGMDKAGHITTAYILSEKSEPFFRKFNWNNRSPFVAAAFGFTYTSTLEVLDAYSEGWGFSVSDLGANFIGSSLYLAQEKLIGDQRLRLKWSFQRSGLAMRNSPLLGESLFEQMFKDYNGQTYWASFNLFSACNKKGLPKWLSVSGGYGINNFTRAQSDQVAGLQPYSQYYLSLDVDWSKIPIRSKHVKNILSALNFIKLPFPTLQLDKKAGLTFHPVYF
ncbi:MAG: DUF2279 domain-containing protein [Flavobacteriales bacterium]